MSEPGSCRVGGVVLGSTDPRRLWEWYRTAFAPPRDGDDRDHGHGGGGGEGGGEAPLLSLELGGTYVIFESRDDVGRKSVEPGRILVTFEVTGICAHEKRLTATLNPRWIRPVEAAGERVLLGTLEDPDGNYVQLFEVTDDSPTA
ncbi:hypothetical protein FM076_13245 [Streptomyces albus subsp. chlorinus]|uniref:hypothetical protein n=1 Tax=Streptomyces albus TaxID=1888 RepID=UPI00156F794A|nr:hypothetical protein [Streptomyces albus]NSC22103.1 hypothetical protein [Streptomyces albus subsp. chlorinus]